jgi:hypothetical protein
MLFSSREFRSLGRNEVPADFKSLNRGETSSFKICVEKLDVGDAAVISLSLNPAFNHFVLIKAFFDHFEFRANFKGFETC